MMQVKELNQRLIHKSITLDLTDAALDYAVAQSYDHMYGARPLRRWLEHHTLTDLSRMIVSGELMEGATVVADADPGKSGLRYTVHKPAEPVNSQNPKRPRWEGQSALDVDPDASEMEE
jgi:ATP-dependent Clp protease ATP-binding subunit ClpB